MRVLLQIPKNPPPQLQGNFSRVFKDFIEMCLQKDPNNRPTAKELLRHAFIRKAKRTTYLVELIERFRDWKRDRANAHQHTASDSDTSSDDDELGGGRNDLQGDGWIQTIRNIDSVIKSNLSNQKFDTVVANTESSSTFKSNNYENTDKNENPSAAGNYYLNMNNHQKTNDNYQISPQKVRKN
jgi:serine/threonine-protein kinase 24/25/MST4